VLVCSERDTLDPATPSHRGLAFPVTLLDPAAPAALANLTVNGR
jgi:hypothetical protein